MYVPSSVIDLLLNVSPADESDTCTSVSDTSPVEIFDTFPRAAVCDSACAFVDSG